MRDRIINVSLMVQGVRRKDGTSGHRTRWIVRDTGAELYSSKTCETEVEARELAAKHLAKLNGRLHLMNGGHLFSRMVYVDTTMTNGAAS